MDQLTQIAALGKSYRITNYFEQGAFEPNFGAWEALDDGRGITAGFAGFCQYEPGGKQPGDLFSVCSRFCQLEQLADGNEWARWVNDKAHFQQLAKDSHNLRQAQLDIAKQLYGDPALQHAESLHLSLPVGVAVVYDTLIQHGDGDDPDSFEGILRRLRIQRRQFNCEDVFLLAFLDERREVLLNPANRETAKDWRESVSRVDALKLLVRQFPQLTGDYEAIIAERF